jgi:hypothetical protein
MIPDWFKNDPAVVQYLPLVSPQLRRLLTERHLALSRASNGDVTCASTEVGKLKILADLIHDFENLALPDADKKQSPLTTPLRRFNGTQSTQKTTTA